MKTIVISGAHSGVGKTSLAAEFLSNLPGWSALKVTLKHPQARTSRITKERPWCPRRRNNCGVCADLKCDYEIITDKKIINQRDTDTARLKQAGAKRTIWLRATPKGLKQGLKKALSKLKDSAGVVIEGTSVLKYIKPDLTIYLAGYSSLLRASARMAQKKADIIVNISNGF